MCICNRQLDPKGRRLRVLANLSLVLGLLLWIFVHPSVRLERDWVDGACGFLLGLSITCNLFGLWRARRSQGWHS
jgi:Zn-dependent protease